MAREFAIGVRFAQVATLPSAATEPGVVLEQGARLWFSDGLTWVDLGAAGGGGGAADYTVVTAGQTLADDTPLLAVLATTATFHAPASPQVGEEYVVRNASSSAAGALAVFDPGAGRSIAYGSGQSLAPGGTLSAARGEQIAVIVRSATVFELQTPGAVGPAGPAGGGGVTGGTGTITVTPAGGALEWLETIPAAGVTPASRVEVRLAGATDADENDPEMIELLGLWGTPGTGTITVGASFGRAVGGPINLHWSIL
ncbi:MAG TPA: hypothetical protein DCM32_05645 [Xanthomonadaceae bacterium]|jgi:hypothetical protein|nr:hypothetical protein [Xanthomonadaceae bacterium]